MDDCIPTSASIYSRRIELAFSAGNKDQAINIVKQFFDQKPQSQLTPEDSISLLLTERIATILIAAGITKIGDLCGESRESLCEIYQIRMRSAWLIEEAMEKHGFSLRKPG